MQKITKMNLTYPSENYKRISQILPSIKGLAILMVVAFHLWGYTKGRPTFLQILAANSGNGFKSLAESFLSILCLMGEQGVHFFLIASGFGLSASWWQKFQASGNKQHFAAVPFWRRRLSRLLPLYWVTNILAVLLVWVQPDLFPYGQEIWARGGLEIGTAIVASLTTIRNIIPKYYFFLNGAWWYIGLSIQLYLIFPFLIWCGKRWGWSSLLVGSLVSSLIYRLGIVILPFDELTTDILLRGALFPSRLFEFVFGIVLAIAIFQTSPLTEVNYFKNIYLFVKKLLFEKHWLPLHIFLWISGLACTWTVTQNAEFSGVPADALIGVGEFCVIFQILSLAPMMNKWLNILGSYSYGIFLTHMNIMIGFWLIFNSGIPNYWLRFALVTVLTCAAGVAFELGYNWLTNKIPMKA